MSDWALRRMMMLRRRLRSPEPLLLPLVLVMGLSVEVAVALSVSPEGRGVITTTNLHLHLHGVVALRRPPSPSPVVLGAEAPRLSSSSSGRRGTGTRTRPDRGTGSGGGGGDRKTRRNEKWHSLRRSGVKAKRRTKAPRWEREGDELYRRAAVAVDDGREARETGGDDDDDSEESVREILRGAGAAARRASSSVRTPPDPASSSPGPPESGKKAKTDAPKKTAPPHTLWGSLPVGPVLRTSLLNSNLTEPTPIQTSSFPVLSSGKNAVLASPTGSGKSLAYLVPLLASSRGRSVPCGIMIVTPTVELAMQLRTVIDRLWPPSGNGDECQSAMHVLGVPRNGEGEGDDALLAGVGDAAVIGGTPRSLRRLMAEARGVLSSSSRGLGGDHGEDDEGRMIATTTARALRSNLRVVVLDEADRLLRTEVAARERDEASEMKQRGKLKSAARKNDDKRKLTQTELLLSELPVQLRNVQLVCASATVGRTLRRQLMDMLDAPSVDKAATLVSARGDARTAKGKDDDATAKRRKGLVPDTLLHRYVIIPPVSSSDDEEEDESSSRVRALCDVISGLPDDPPAPVLVFPGRIGVETVRRGLLLPDGRGEDGAGPATREVRTLADIRSEGGGGQGIDGGAEPVYVVEDRLGRGLDLPDVRYVLLPGGPPSGPAGYAHLAGRTGRNGRTGTAVTFVRGAKEARRLAAIADALGLSLEELKEDGGGETEGVAATSAVAASGSTAEVAEDTGEIITGNEAGRRDAAPMQRDQGGHPWRNLSEAALKRKTIAQLVEYLEGYGITLADPAGRKVRKADLVSAILRLDANIAQSEG